MAEVIRDEAFPLDRTPAKSSLDSIRRRVKLMGDSLDGSIADHLIAEQASAAEIAQSLGVPAATVRRRLRKLLVSGIIDCSGRTRRRGVSELLYTMSLNRGLVRCGEMAAVPAKVRDEAVARLLRSMFREVMSAIESGVFYARDQFVLHRFPIPLDDEGWDDAIALHEDLVDSVVEVAERGKARVERRGDNGLRARAMVLFCEAPASWPLPLAEDRSPDGPARWSARNQVEFVRRLRDPLRRRVLDALVVGPAGVGDLVAQCGGSPEKVRYELKRLRSEGVITVHSRRQRRGTEELVYIGEPRNSIFRAEDVSESAEADLEGFCRNVVTELFRDVVAAAKAKAFNDREDVALVRLPLRVDEQAFGEIRELTDDALDQLLDLRDESLKRMAGREDKLRKAFSGVLLFEQAP